MRNPISHRIIAGILLLNHSLLSCSNPNMHVGPLKEGHPRVINMNQDQEQLAIEALAEEQDLVPVISPEESVIHLDLKEEAPTLIKENQVLSTQQRLSNSLTTQTNQPRSFDVDPRSSKLETTLANKENTRASLGSPADKDHQALKQIRQPISLKIPSSTQVTRMNTYPSDQFTDATHVRQHVEKKRKSQCIRQLEPIKPFADQGQQELHTRIVQIMQNPVWQRHFSDRQQNTTQLLPSTHLQLFPIHRHYQLARVQTSLPPLLLIKSLQIKQGRPLY